MGDESAYAWMDEAIRGVDVPADQREAYNPETIFNKGSANIAVLNGANDAWWHWWHDRANLPPIIAAWKRYFDCKGKFYHGQSEPYGCFRYASWQNMSLIAMHGLAQVMGDDELEDLCARWIRYRIFTFGLVACWWNYAGGLVAGPYAGVRSWVGPKQPGGGRPFPYAGLPENGGAADNYSNVRGTVNNAAWEEEPILRELERAHGYKRWNCITNNEVDLLKRTANTKKKLTDAQVADRQALCDLIKDTRFVIHMEVHFFRTDQGSAIIFMKSHSSGSTSMKFGGVVIKGGRDGSEMQETWADDRVDPMFKWTAEAPYNRQSDPSGVGGFRVFDNKVEIFCTTNDGAAANGFEPGGGRYYAQWVNGDPRSMASWPEGERVATLPGKLLTHEFIKQKQATVTRQFPAGGGQPDPGPGEPDGGDMAEPGTKYRVRNIARTLELLEKNNNNVDKAKKDAMTDEEFQKTLKGEHDKQREADG